MKLTPKPKTGRHPTFRIKQSTRDAFRARCRKAGVSQDQALRQLIAQYLAKPFKPTVETKNVAMATVRDTQANIDALKRLAAKYQVSDSELIRQIIYRFLET